MTLELLSKVLVKVINLFDTLLVLVTVSLILNLDILVFLERFLRIDAFNPLIAVLLSDPWRNTR